jgi:hypothetical protein
MGEPPRQPMTDLSDAGVRVLVIATATHRGPSLPSVAHTVDDLRMALVQRCGVRPDCLRVILDPPDAQAMAVAISEEAQRAETVLLFYFIGHGLLGPGGELYLAANGTDELVPGVAEFQALSLSALRRAVGSGRASSVVVVLDWFGDSGEVNDRGFALEPAPGLYLIGSAGQFAAAPNGRHTALTGALIDLLLHGDPREPYLLTLDSVYDALFRTMREQNLPLPHLRAGDRSGNLVLAPNPAVPASLPEEQEPAPGRCPYPGLVPFTIDDAGLFSGREQMTSRMLTADHSGASGPLILVGPSGSGKTSLLHAGFLASLHENGLPGSADWPCLYLTPGASPLRSLAAGLTTSADSTADLLRQDPGSVVSLVEDLPGDRLIVVIDQLEEMFTLCPDPVERTAFARAVAALAGDGRALVVLTLRADFYGHAVGHPELLAALRDNQLLVEPMTLDDLRAAIERPAAAAGWELDEGEQSTVQAHCGPPVAAEHHRPGRGRHRIDHDLRHPVQTGRHRDLCQQPPQSTVVVDRFQRDDPAPPCLPDRDDPEQQARSGEYQDRPPGAHPPGRWWLIAGPAFRVGLVLLGEDEFDLQGALVGVRPAGQLAATPA